MFCKNCGNQLPDNALFCGSCGTKVEAPAAPQQPAYEAPQPAPQQPAYVAPQPAPQPVQPQRPAQQNPGDSFDDIMSILRQRKPRNDFGNGRR